jgi:hypothetical protein
MQFFTHLSVFFCLFQHSVAEGFGEKSHHADFKNKVSSRCAGTFLGYLFLSFLVAQEQLQFCTCMCISGSHCLLAQ